MQPPTGISALTRSEQGERYVSIRCPGCGEPLWRRYRDRIEMPITIRGGQKRVIVAAVEGMGVLRVQCEKCGAWWLGTSQATLHREDDPPPSAA